MFINPKKAIVEGWLRGNIKDAQIQPNGIDIPVHALYELDSNSTCIITAKDKKHRPRKLVQPHVRRLVIGTTPDKKEITADYRSWYLKLGVYDYTTDLYVEMPEGFAGWVQTRSSLNRNGVLVTSGLYDSGFKGHVNGLIYVLNGPVILEVGACAGQFVISASEKAGIYAGGYNTNEGAVDKHITESLKG